MAFLVFGPSIGDAGKERMEAQPSQADREALRGALASAVRGGVRFDRHDRMLYATDASLYQVEPIGVVIPADIEDAVRAVSLCVAHGAPILPRGGGTSLAGQCVNNAVVIDFSPNCRAVGEVSGAAGRVSRPSSDNAHGANGTSTEQASVRVQPGVCLDELNEELARRGHGLFFAPDVATSRHANIGGMIGNNSAGARSILYGRTVEHVRSVEVALAHEKGRVVRATLEEGAALRDDAVRALSERVVDVVQRAAPAIRDRFPKTLRQSSGYNLDLILDQLERPGDPLANVNLAPLVCGSEGTLAVTLGAGLHLEPTPIAKGLSILSFNSVRDAIAVVNPILEAKPSAVELLDDMVLRLARRNTTYEGAVDLLPRAGGRDPAAVLYVEFYAFNDADEIEDRFAVLRRVAGDRPMVTMTGAHEMARAWSLRKAAEPLLHGLPGLRKPVTFVEDTAVPPERLPEFVERFRAIVRSHGTEAAFYAHASVGCLHIRPLLDVHEGADRDRLRAIAVAVADLVREFGGTMTGEHGDGRARGPLLERVFGSELTDAFREIKAIFDPRNLLNPGNIVEPGPIESITTRLRVLPEREEIRTPAVETYFDYSDQHGFASAVEMCNGAGVCRKKTGATMCPSYMATLDERHSTRGRGNALRLAITGQLGAPAPDWNDAESMRTLDWCLSCKACKAECPSNVDVARLKSEFIAQGHKAGAAVSVRDRFFANVRALNRAGATAPGLANAAQRNPVVRAIVNRALGVAPARSLPGFAHSLARRARRLPDAPPVYTRGEVALVVDCFTGYGESEIGLAAIDALRSLGWRVRLVDAGCCQRPAVSLGLLDRAVSRGGQFLQTLASLSDEEPIAAILFLEPSCLSAAVDDLPALKTEVPADHARRIAARCMLVDDFLARELGEQSQISAPIQPTGPPVLLHAHCHQKAILGDDSSVGLVRRLVGDRLAALDAGCCGMAGAFGMTRARFDLSMKIGELALLPAVRSAPTDAIILAPGASCRHQIRDGADRDALHPVQLAAGILRPWRMDDRQKEPR